MMMTMKTYSERCLAISTFFWLWAIWNSFTKYLDLGVISFFTVMLSSFSLRTRYSNSSENSNDKEEMKYPIIVIGFSVFSHLFVSLNYMLGALITLKKKPERTGFIAYCVIFSGVWIVSAGMVYKLTKASVDDKKSK